MKKLIIILAFIMGSSAIYAQKKIDLGGGFDVTYSTSTSAINIIPYATYNISDNHNVSAGFIIAPYQLLYPEAKSNYGSWGLKGAYWAYEYQFGDRRSEVPIKFALQYNGFYQLQKDIGFINFTDKPEIPFGEYSHSISYIDNYVLANVKIRITNWLNASISAGCGVSLQKTSYDWYGIDEDYFFNDTKFSVSGKIGLLYKM